MKEKAWPREVCLDPKHRLAKEYPHGDIFEQVTEPDVSPSLAQMVATGIVGTKGSNNYYYPELPEDDDEAHNFPDTMKLGRMDIAEREEFIENFVNDENNYEQEKENLSPETPTKEKAPEEKPENKPKDGTSNTTGNTTITV